MIRRSMMTSEKAKWDLQTVTAGDYSVRIDLSSSQVHKLKSQCHHSHDLNAPSDVPIGYQMKILLVKEIEHSLFNVITA